MLVQIFGMLLGYWAIGLFGLLCNSVSQVRMCDPDHLFFAFFKSDKLFIHPIIKNKVLPLYRLNFH